MAFPTAVNDAKSNKRSITTPVTESEINEAFKAVQSKDAAGPITMDVLIAFVQYVALNFDGDVGSMSTTSFAMAAKILDYLQGYDGVNKRCTLMLIYGGTVFIEWQVAPANGVGCDWVQGMFGGVNQDYGIMCQMTWD